MKDHTDHNDSTRESDQTMIMSSNGKRTLTEHLSIIYVSLMSNSHIGTVIALILPNECIEKRWKNLEVALLSSKDVGSKTPSTFRMQGFIAMRGPVAEKYSG